MTADYNDGKWHGWNGGECPVHPKSVVVCVSAIGKFNNILAGHDHWEHVHGDDDIIAFRVIKEHKEPREFWIVKQSPGMDATIFDDKPKCANYYGDEIIHVREVIK